MFCTSIARTFSRINSWWWYVPPADVVVSGYTRNTGGAVFVLSLPTSMEVRGGQGARFSAFMSLLSRDTYTDRDRQEEDRSGGGSRLGYRICRCRSSIWLRCMINMCSVLGTTSDKGQTIDLWLTAPAFRHISVFSVKRFARNIDELLA